MSTLTLRLSQEEENIVERLKDATGHTAASKALVCAAAQFLTKIQPLERKVAILEKQLSSERQKVKLISQYQQTIRESEDAIRKILRNDSRYSAEAAAGASDLEDV